MFIKSAPACQGNSTADIQAWCISFTQFAASKGTCAHPHFCFQKDHISSIKGFSVREDDDFLQHDSPGRHTPSLVTWSQQICQAMSSNKVFPPGTCDVQIGIVKSHASGHGCKALPATIQSHHPTCHPHPTTSVRDPPKQRSGEETSSHFCQCTDHLQMRAHLKDNNHNLDDEVKLEDFLDGAIHKIQF